MAAASSSPAERVPRGDATPAVAVVIPCYRVRAQIGGVLERIGPAVTAIYCVDDACPEGSGKWIQESVRDPRVRVLFHASNQGVGGATLTGFRAALADGARILVKIDGDGQMDPAILGHFTRPLLEGRADCTKGNRFFHLEDARSMPRVRLFGNAVLSFLAKLSTGYWPLFDPTNGYCALHASVARRLPFERIDRRWFFESDLLFHLYQQRAVVLNVPMTARYAAEPSSLRPHRVVLPFLARHAANFGRRIFTNYFLRDFSIASVNLVLGLALCALGAGFGAIEWVAGIRSGEPATAGTVMLAALPIIVGVQLLLSFLSYDIGNVPQVPLHRLSSDPD